MSRIAKPHKGDNVGVAVTAATSHAGRNAEMDAFDAMPEPIRKVLNTASVKFLAIDLLPVLDKAPPWRIAALLAREADDISRREWKEAFGTDYPTATTKGDQDR